MMNRNPPKTGEVPKPIEAYLTLPLYTKSYFADLESTWAAIDVLYYVSTYDSYCTKCRRDATFSMAHTAVPEEFTRNLRYEANFRKAGAQIPIPKLQNGTYTVRAHCTRDRSHEQHFIFLIDEVFNRLADGQIQRRQSFEKIGQHPSYGDLHSAKVKKYTHVLSEAQLSEFSRAIGLASHDVGVGSYTYLRRVFTSLVEEAHQLENADPGWDEQRYLDSRMSERISMLRAHLPAFLVENPSMYALLSKGIHEMTEDECLRHFDTLRIGIELILDQRLEERERRQKTDAAKAALQKALQEPKS